MHDGPFYIVGNWKSNKSIEESVAWMHEFSALWQKQPLSLKKIKIVVCPSVLHLTTLSSLITLAHLPLELGLQDVSAYSQGAYTGQVSASMVKELVRFSLVGHSERRKYNKEVEAELFEKVKQAKVVGIEPIYCVQNGEMAVPAECRIVGYEPLFAIGTGKPDTPENASTVAQLIKKRHPQVECVIYGGSVTDQNVGSYRKNHDINGVLPGGASLTADSFYRLIQHAVTA